MKDRHTKRSVTAHTSIELEQVYEHHKDTTNKKLEIVNSKTDLTEETQVCANSVTNH